MPLTVQQIKGRLKSIAQKNHADARILMRLYMMERFLERLSKSKYSDDFIIKGGILVTSMIGVSMRSTMDIDTTIRNLNLSEEDMKKIVEEIAALDIGDGIKFVIKDVSTIMDNMEYPGVRIAMDACAGKTITPLKIDISTNDIITPRAIEYKYKLLLEEREINLWTYNLETILAEKMQTILARGLLNTRMRDFYDIHVLLIRYRESLDYAILGRAFESTCKKRGSEQLSMEGEQIIQSIENDLKISRLWESYQKKFTYAAEISYNDVIDSIKELFELITT